MRYIMNSAVISTPGRYSYRLVEMEEAIRWLSGNDWISAIGYPETASALSALTGVSIPANRQMVEMQKGDEALVFRLTRRVSNPGMKGSLTSDFVRQNYEIGVLKKEG